MWTHNLFCLLKVYKRKTEAAKKEYLKALAAYKANQLSQVTSCGPLRKHTHSSTLPNSFSLFIFQPATEEMEMAASPPPPAVSLTHTALAPAAQQVTRPANSGLEENTITNICASNIILDVPEMTTRSRTGANKASAPPAAAAAAAPPAQTITKIIIPKHMLQAGGQVVTVLPGGVRTLQPTLVVSGASRQPPPLQQMQNAPPPPRLQQMAPAPPPLQAKPREGSTATPGLPVSVTATPPPPLQIKIVPASLQGKDALPIIVPNTAAPSAAMTTSAQSASIVAVQVMNPADVSGSPEEEDVTEVLPSEEVTQLHSL